MNLMKYLTAMLLFCTLLCSHAFAEETDQSKKEVASFLTELFTQRANLLVNRQAETVKKYYLDAEKTSSYAFRQQLRRSEYLNTWAQKRHVTLTGANDRIRIIRIKLQGDLAKVSLIDSVKLTYSYRDTNLQQSFGVGTRNSLTLKRTSYGWRVLREWFLDPLDVDAALVPDSGTAWQPSEIHRKNRPLAVTSSSKKYNRKQAVAYAQKYAGAAWGAGNSNRYNPRYRDYTYVGGDCTNFASQVIGDAKEGGGLRMRSGWHYYGNAGGTKSWVRTDSFKNFLFYSGYGRLIARGYYEQLVKNGALAKVQPGDLIAYEIGRGNVEHFAVVVGFDVNGYPLVNCHTTDRFSMPFDIGWDKDTRFLLIHIKD